VNDPSGAVITSATLQATNQDTNVTQSTRTNSVGLYTFPRLTPGRYRISVKSSGFKEHIQTDLVLHVGDTVSVNFNMELGSSSESVSVAASSTLVNTEDATVGTVIERQVVENMPLNGRSFQGLITLSPWRCDRRAVRRKHWTVRHQRAANRYELFHRGWRERQCRRASRGFAAVERRRSFPH
jgi:hypothetical protein